MKLKEFLKSIVNRIYRGRLGQVVWRGSYPLKSGSSPGAATKLKEVSMKKLVAIKSLSVLLMTAQAITSIVVCVDSTIRLCDTIRVRLRDKKDRGVGFTQKGSRKKS